MRGHAGGRVLEWNPFDPCWNACGAMLGAYPVATERGLVCAQDCADLYGLETQTWDDVGFCEECGQELVLTDGVLRCLTGHLA